MVPASSDLVSHLVQGTTRLPRAHGSRYHYLRRQLPPYGDDGRPHRRSGGQPVVDQTWRCRAAAYRAAGSDE